MHDPATERENRQPVSNMQLNDAILQTLQTIMHQLNPFAQSFKSMARVTRDQRVDNVRMVIQSENTPDRRCYSAPTADEVRIIIVDNHDENVGH